MVLNNISPELAAVYSTAIYWNELVFVKLKVAALAWSHLSFDLSPSVVKPTAAGFGSHLTAQPCWLSRRHKSSPGLHATHRQSNYRAVDDIGEVEFDVSRSVDFMIALVGEAQTGFT